MSEAVSDIVLRIKVEADIAAAKSRIAELSALAQAPAAGVSSVTPNAAGTAHGIAREIAGLRKLADERYRALKEGPELSTADKAGTRAAKFNRFANSEINKFLNESLKGLDEGMQASVKGLVGKKPLQQKYYKSGDYAASAAEADAARFDPSRRGTREAYKQSQEAERHVERLRAGGADPTFVKSLLGLDIETKRFAGTMTNARTGSIEYQKAAIDASIAHRLGTTKLQQGQNASTEYQKAMVEGAVAQRQGAAKLLQGTSVQDAYIRATADSTAARRATRERAGIVERGGTTAGLTPTEIRDKYAAATRGERLTDQARQARAAVGDPADIKARVNARTASAALDAKVKEATNATAGYIDDQVRLRGSNRDLANRLKARAAGYSDDDIKARGGTESAAATAGFVQTQRRRGLVATNITDQEIRDAAQSRASMAGVNNAIKLQEKTILRQMINSGELGGTFVQRKMALWSPGQRTPADFAGGAANIKAKAFTTLGYGASAVATGALFGEVTETLRDAAKLEATFVRMKGQLSGLGRSGDFPEMRSQIKGISTETGVAATDAAEFSSRMLGVFSDKSTAEVTRETSDAMKLMTVAGVDASTMLQSTIPIAKSFNVSMKDIGNTAVEVGERLGLPEDQVLGFLGKAAIVAKQAGLEMRELAIIGGVMGQQTGKNLASSADVFNKMPELVQRNQSKIFEILRRSPKTEPFVARMQAELGQGKPGQALVEMLRAAAQDGGLSAIDMKELPKLIANPREIEEATAIITEAKKTVGQIDDKTFLAGGGVSALQSRFDKLKDTVQQSFQRIERAIEGFGETLFDLGVADVFTTIAGAAGIALGAIGLFTTAVSDLNNLTKSLGFSDGLLSPMIKIGLQAAILVKLVSVMNALRIKAVGWLAKSAAGESADAAARTTNAAAARTEAAAVAEAEAVQARSAAGANVRPLSSAGLPYRNAPLLTSAGLPLRSGAAGTAAAAAAGVAARKAEEEALRAATANSLARSKSAGYQLGQWRSTTERASFTSRAFSGGGTSRLNPLRNVTAGANASVASAGGTPGIVGAGLVLPLAAIIAAGALAVKTSYDAEKEKSETAVEDLRTKMRTANRAKLQRIVDDGASIMDNLHAAIFGHDTPDEMAKAGIAYQEATAGRDALKGLQTAGATGTFAERIGRSPEATKRLEEFLNRDSASKRLAQEIGLGGAYGSQDRNEWHEMRQIGAGDSWDLAHFQVRPEDTQKIVDAAREATEKGDTEKAHQFAKLLGEDILNLPGMEDLKGSARSGKVLNTLEADMEKAGGPAAYLELDYGQLKQAKATGRMGSGEFLGKARKRLAQAKADVAVMRDDEYKKEAQAAADQFETEVRAADDEAVKTRLATLNAFGERSGRDDIERFRLGNLTKLLPTYTKGAQLAALPDALDQLDKAWEEELAAIGDPLERARVRMEGQKIPEAIRRLEMEAAITNDSDLSQGLSNLAPLLGMSTEQAIAWVAEQVLKSNVSIAEATDKALKEKRDKLGTTLAPVGAGTDAYIPSLGPWGGTPEVQETSDERERIQVQRANSLLELGGEATRNVVAGMAGYFNKDTQGMSRLIIAKSDEWNVTTAEALKRLLIERRDEALASANPDPARIAFLNNLIDQADNAPDQTPEETEKVKHKRERDVRRKDLADISAVQKADVDLAAAGARGDPLVQAHAALDDAWLDYENELTLQTEGLDDPAARKAAELKVAQQTAAVEDARRDAQLARLDWIEINAHGDPQEEIRGRIEKARLILANAIADAGGNMDATPVIKAQQDMAKLGEDAIDADLNVQRSIFSVLASQVARDPMASALVAQKKAAFELSNARGTSDENEKIAAMNNANDAVEDASLAIETSVFSILKAQAARDPLKSAQIARDQAAFELENARGQADENEKAAALITAEHGVEDAISALYESRANLAIALAEAGGDPVKAAELAAREAKRKLDEAIARGASETELNPLRASFATTNEAFFKSGRSREEQIIDFQKDMGQITTQTAIESLKLILGRTKEGTDEYMQLAMKIHQLEQSAGQDLQFNLPTTLGLPTLYEARRMDQGTMAGIGYQDNRNVVMSISVNGAQDPMVVASQVMAAFQSATASGGNTYTPSVGVGR